MNIERLSISADVYAHCKSSYYSTIDATPMDTSYNFSVGINVSCGEIDAGFWVISYLISMYKYRKKDFVLLNNPNIQINDNDLISLNELSEYSCYMDFMHPLFSSKKKVKRLIEQGIKKNNLSCTFEEISSLFSLSDERVNRSLRGAGNEKFRVMAAIAYCHNKQIFCFPWMSKKLHDGFHNHITDTIEVLEKLGKIVLLPIGKIGDSSGGMKKTGDGSVSCDYQRQKR